MKVIKIVAAALYAPIAVLWSLCMLNAGRMTSMNIALMRRSYTAESEIQVKSTIYFALAVLMIAAGVLLFVFAFKKSHSRVFSVITSVTVLAATALPFVLPLSPFKVSFQNLLVLFMTVGDYFKLPSMSYLTEASSASFLYYATHPAILFAIALTAVVCQNISVILKRNKT